MVLNFSELDELNHVKDLSRNLEIRDVKPAILDKYKLNMGHIYQKVPPNIQLLLNKDDDLGSHEHCILADTEFLSLVFNIGNNKSEHNDFRFMYKATEIDMDNYATFHVIMTNYCLLVKFKK